MKISKITFGMLRVPLKTPFKTALRTVERVEDIVVMVHTDTGHVGYGEAPATAVITGDTHGSIVDAIRHYISPRLIGEDIADLNRITRLIQTSMEKNSSAKAAVEIAIYDLWAQLYDAPLYKMLGGGDPVITTDITISVDTIDKMVADSISAVDRGFDSLKIKVGKDIGVDSSGPRRSTPRSRTVPCCGSTPTRAGPPSRRCSPSAPWRTPGCGWSWSSNRSRHATWKGCVTSPSACTPRSWPTKACSDRWK